MKINSVTRDWLKSVTTLVVSPGQTQETARAVLVEHVANVTRRFDEAVAYRDKWLLLGVSRGFKHSNTLKVNKYAMLVRWAEADLAHFDKLGLDAFRKYIRGY